MNELLGNDIYALGTSPRGLKRQVSQYGLKRHFRNLLLISLLPIALIGGGSTLNVRAPRIFNRKAPAEVIVTENGGVISESVLTEGQIEEALTRSPEGGKLEVEIDQFSLARALLILSAPALPAIVLQARAISNKELKLSLTQDELNDLILGWEEQLKQLADEADELDFQVGQIFSVDTRRSGQLSQRLVNIQADFRNILEKLGNLDAIDDTLPADQISQFSVKLEKYVIAANQTAELVEDYLTAERLVKYLLAEQEKIAGSEIPVMLHASDALKLHSVKQELAQVKFHAEEIFEVRDEAKDSLAKLLI